MGILSWLFEPNNKKSKGEKQQQVGTMSRVQIKDSWKGVQELASLGGPSQLRQAVMKADKIVDAALQLKGMDGGTMGDRLKRAGKLFPNKVIYQNLWDAHKVRNAMAHDLTYEPPHYVLKTAIKRFGQALKVLRI